MVPGRLHHESFPGQFRNWFYALLAMSTVMTLDTEFDAQPPFKTLFSYALLRDEHGEEMHKSKGNAIWFDEAAEQMGVDVMRWMYCARRRPATSTSATAPATRSSAASSARCGTRTRFFVTYASIDELDAGAPALRRGDERCTELDRWILSELNQLVQSVTAALEGYDSMAAARQIEDFVEELSNWYVRRSRRRFWKSESRRRQAGRLLRRCGRASTTVDRLLAPFMPFLAEEMYQNLVRGVDATAAESVHLDDWPVADEA